MPKKPENNVPSEGGQYALMPSSSPPTIERQAFVRGLFNELNEQLQRYLQFVSQSADVHARLMLMERNLRLTREHMWLVLNNTQEEVPPDWKRTLAKIRFVGARLGDACTDVLREHKTVTTEQMLWALNQGQFRFRTSSPLREIHAALLRHPNVKREEDTWRWVETKTEERLQPATEVIVS